MRISFCIIPVLACIGLSACSSQKPLYAQEDFSDSSTFSKTFIATGDDACAAIAQTLLGQGYILTNQADKKTVNGSKKFQPDTDHHVEITFNAVCTTPRTKTSTATAFVNAVQDTYVLKKTNTSASVGVSVLGSLSMPIGSSDDSLVHVGSETIRSKEFYDRFFNAVERTLISHGHYQEPTDMLTPEQTNLVPIK